MRAQGSTWNQVDDDQAAWIVWSGGLAQVLFESIACGCTARGDLDFPIDRLQVGVDRARTDDEVFGDLGVGQSLSQQAQHLHFARCQPVRIGECRFRRWSWGCLSWDRHRSSSCQGLLPCHTTSLGPGHRKGLLTQLGMCGSDGALVVGTGDGWQGRAEGVAQDCRCGQEPHCPCRLTLRRDHDGQTSKQALFIHRACCCEVTLGGEDLSEKSALRGEHSLIRNLLPKRVALFNQQARGRRLTLSEGDLTLESQRKRFSTRDARFSCERETLLCQGLRSHEIPLPKHHTGQGHERHRHPSGVAHFPEHLYALLCEWVDPGILALV